MFRFASIAFLAIPFSVSLVSGALLSSNAHKGNNLHARRLGESYAQLGVAKRASGKVTWYETGLGACGGYNTPNDWIIALNAEEWAGGSHCGEEVTLTYNGVTRTGRIADECMGCVTGELDLSHGLFSEFGDPDQLGQFFGTWSFGKGEEPKPTTTKPPKTTSTPPPEPTTTSTTEKTTSSTWTPEPTTSSTSTTSSSAESTTSSTASSSESSSSASTTSSSAMPEATVASIDYSQAIGQLNLAFGQMGSLMVAGLSVSA